MQTQDTTDVDIDDPIIIKRERIRKRVKQGKRIGYGLMLLSIVAMFLCIPLGWPIYLTIISMVSFTLSCAILPMPIIYGYAIKAAEREDKKIGY